MTGEKPCAQSEQLWARRAALPNATFSGKSWGWPVFSCHGVVTVTGHCFDSLTRKFTKPKFFQWLKYEFMFHCIKCFIEVQEKRKLSSGHRHVSTLVSEVSDEPNVIGNTSFPHKASLNFINNWTQYLPSVISDYWGINLVVIIQ